MTKRIAFVLTVALLSTMFALSQTIIKDSVVLDDLIVTGTKTEIKRQLVPLSVSQISAKEIEHTGHNNVLQTLNSFVPGIFVTERSLLGFGVAAGGSGSISIRGISSSPNTNVLVLIDGHPQYQGIFGHPLPDAYVASDIKKVEVIRGPASILYGSNAMAGVINMITKKQEKKGLSANLGASYGSYNTQKYHGNIGLKAKKIHALLSVNHDKTDGIRPNTDFEITNAYSKLGFDIGKYFKLTADANVAKYFANDNGPITNPQPFAIDILRGKAAISLDNTIGNFDGSLKIYHNYGTHNLSDGFVSFDQNSGLMLYETYRVMENTSFTLGVDIKQYGGIVNAPTLANELNKKINEQAVYASIQQYLFNRLMLSGGVRFENNSVFGNAMIPMSGISYNFNEKSTFRASISGGFRSPTLMELYLYAPNPNLQPENMLNYEIGWLQSAFNHRLNSEVTIFKVKGNDLIQVVGGVPPMRQNIGKFENTGVEMAINFAATRNLTMNANYSYVDFKKKVLAAPRTQINIGANLQAGAFNFNLAGQWVDNIYTRIERTTPIETIPAVVQSYFLLNARVAVKVFKTIEIHAMANNILNADYEINYGYPMPKRFFSTGMQLKF